MATSVTSSSLYVIAGYCDQCNEVIIMHSSQPLDKHTKVAESVDNYVKSEIKKFPYVSSKQFKICVTVPLRDGESPEITSREAPSSWQHQIFHTKSTPLSTISCTCVSCCSTTSCCQSLFKALSGCFGVIGSCLSSCCSQFSQCCNNTPSFCVSCISACCCDCDDEQISYVSSNRNRSEGLSYGYGISGLGYTIDGINITTCE